MIQNEQQKSVKLVTDVATNFGLQNAPSSGHQTTHICTAKLPKSISMIQNEQQKSVKSHICTAKLPKPISMIQNEQQKSVKLVTDVAKQQDNVSTAAQLTTKSSTDEYKEVTDDFFGMQSYEDLGLLSNTSPDSN